MSDLFSGLTTSLKSTATALSRNEYVRKIAETMNDTIMNYSEQEVAVREATNEDPWGPTGPQMKKISEFTKSRHMEDFYNVYTPLFTRMLENNKDAWRRVYKSLVLFDYLLKNGSERFVAESMEKVSEVRRLEHYKYIDDKGKDQGINIRHRAKLIVDMMNDDQALRDERKKASSDDKSKYRGYDQYDMKSSASGFGSYKNSSSSSFDANRGSSNNDLNSSFGKSSREVSNFSFTASKDLSPSPELGFADDTVKKTEDDDDGFGDFVSSRTTQPAKTTVNTAKTHSNDSKVHLKMQLELRKIGKEGKHESDDLFANIPAIPLPTTGSLVGSTTSALPRKPSLDNSNFDLLGGLDAPASSTVPAAASPIPNVDLFSQIITPVNNSALLTTGQSQGNDLFDFGASPIVPSQPSQPTLSSNSFGGLNDLTFGQSLNATPAVASSATLNSTSNNKATNDAKDANAPRVGNSFAGLDDFMNLSLSSSANSTPKAKTLNQMKGGL